MDSLSAFPGIGKRLVRRSTDITRDQRVHGLGCHVRGGLASARDLGDLGIEDALLVRVDLESSQHVDLFD